MHDQTKTNGASQQAIELPNGVFPPMPGYTHEDLLVVVNEPVEAFLESLGVDPGFIRETSIALVSRLWADLQRMGIEYQISTWYQTPYADAATRARNVSNMALDVGNFVKRSAYQSLEGSPLLNAGDDVVAAFTDKAAWGIHDHIVKLNDKALMNPADLMGKKAERVRDGYSDEVPNTPFELTPNVLPPLAGYAVDDLVVVGSGPIEALLQGHNIESDQTRNSLVELKKYLAKGFNSSAVECLIPFHYLQPLDDAALRASNIAELAQDAGGVAAKAADDFLRSSPLLERGEAFCIEFYQCVGFAIRDHILQLNATRAEAGSAPLH
ncbi:hypothetical protein ACI2KG_26855 [Pseudomonas sp. NPDC089407]|uniref:hypothetical protein n=1 Tax=Pseudomonas sp. NPDC089407 TaxID=3364464 RepID=UPI00384E6762